MADRDDDFKQLPEEDSDGIDDTPLDPEEIEEAKERIVELHPLKELPYERVFPMFACCLKRFGKKKEGRVQAQKPSPWEKLKAAGKDLEVSFQSPLLQKEDAEDEFDANTDPYLSLGFGMVAYFSMLRSLILMFSIFTLISIPMMSTYKQYDGLSTGNNYSKTKYSLGNFGFTEYMCKHIFRGIDGNYQFACRTGKIQSLTWAGILPHNDDQEKFAEYMGFCNNPKDFPAVDACSGALKGEAIKNYVDTNCKGQQNCKSSISVNDMLNDQATTKGVDPHCWDNDSIIYLQYDCEQTTEELNKKRNEGLIIACLGILISTLFLTCMYFLSKVAAIEFKEWDVGTVTASDFTVEYQIPDGVWKKFEDAHTDKSKAEGSDFEEYLKKEFERIVSAQESVLFTGEAKTAPVRIANVTFAFNNAKLIGLLRKRGTAVAAGRFVDLPKIDVAINDLKNKEIQSLTKPVAAFITFETQDGFERACEFKHTISCQGVISADHEFDGEPLFFEDAPEPTNIIWEHRQITYKEQIFRTSIVYSIIVFLLFLAFMAFYTLKQQTIANYNKYPPSTNCSDLYSIFGVDKGNKVADNTNFMDNANNDKDLILKFGTGTGVYQCYCSALQKEIGTVAILDNATCRMFTQDFFGGKALSQVVSISIVVINLILRTLMLYLIKWIGHHTESEQTAAIMSSIFIVQFFNTAILLILTNANTADAGLGFLPFKGKYNDLNFEWYNDVGASFIITMGTAAVFPVIEFCIAFSMKFAFQFLDRGFSMDKSKTKKNTIQAYINLYSGPEYMMHFKYSGMMNVLFVCFMYGLAIPALFPISLLAFTVLYTVEKMTITYFFRKPPMFDEKLNESSISKMKWAPIFMMFFGYWCLTNKQIFTNESYEIYRTTEAVQTGHKMWSFAANSGLPLFLCGLIMGFLIFFNDLALSVLNKWGIMLPEAEDEVDEGLGTYWQCLNEHDRREWYLDETHMRKNLNLITLDEEAYDKLKNEKPGNKVMNTTANYEMVSNPKYAEQFQYCPIDFRDTEEEKETSNMVLKILNLAYTPEEHIKSFDFKGTASSKRKSKKNAIN